MISTSGVLGKYIALSPSVTIWWRCALAALALGVFCLYSKVSLSINKKDVRSTFLSAIFLGVHWITYFYSLHLSNVAIAMLSLFTFPVITAFLEPIFYKTRFDSFQLILAGLVLLGIYFLVPDLNLANDQTFGVMLGLFSAIAYTIRNLLIKKQVAIYPGSTLMFYQLTIMSVLLLPLFFFESIDPIDYWPAIVILALVTTATGHTFFVRSFKNFSLTTASIISSLQPIYGIILGIIILNEIPASRTLIGGALILATVVLESIRSMRS